MLEGPQLHSLTDGLLIDTLQLQVRVYHVKEVGGLILVYQWILLEKQFCQLREIFEFEQLLDLIDEVLPQVYCLEVFKHWKGLVERYDIVLSKIE